MPSALSASRDFAARAIARVRSGVESYERNIRKPGKEIKVEPFDSQNVSTPAALIKLGTSIAAARRNQANLQEAQKDIELEREKNRASIAHLRALTKQAETPKAATTARGPARLERKVGQYESGTLVTDVNADLAERRLTEAKASRARREERTGKVTAARAGLQQIEKAVERDVQRQATLDVGTWEPVFAAAKSPYPKLQAKALVRLGINPADFRDTYVQPTRRIDLLNAARKRIFDARANISRISISKFYQPDRDKYQAIIDEGAGVETGQGDEGLEGFYGGAEGQGGDPLDGFYGQ